MGIKTGKPLETLAVFGLQSFRPHVLVGEDGFEPSKRNAADLQSVPFGHSGTPPYSVRSAETEQEYYSMEFRNVKNFFSRFLKKSAGLV